MSDNRSRRLQVEVRRGSNGAENCFRRMESQNHRTDMPGLSNDSKWSPPQSGGRSVWACILGLSPMPGGRCKFRTPRGRLTHYPAPSAHPRLQAGFCSLSEKRPHSYLAQRLVGLFRDTGACQKALWGDTPAASARGLRRKGVSSFGSHPFLTS